MANLTWDDVELKNQNRDNTGVSTGIDSGSNVTHGYNHGSITRGLVAYYPFDGDVKDKTPLGNDGTDNTSAGYVSGKVGSDAKDFDGSDDGVKFSGIPQLSGDFTVAFWIYSRSTGTSVPSVKGTGSTGSPYVMIERDDGSGFPKDMEFQTAPDSDSNNSVNIAATDAITKDTWIHVAGTYDDSTNEMEIYIDGSSKNTGSNSNVSDGDDGVYLGGKNSNNELDGLIDDHRIYTRVLSLPEIKKLYNTTSTSTVTDKDVL